MTGPSTAPRVLIVDDESGILDSLRILLKGEGFTPIVAQGGRQGLEQLGDGVVVLFLEGMMNKNFFLSVSYAINIPNSNDPILKKNTVMLRKGLRKMSLSF